MQLTGPCCRIAAVSCLRNTRMFTVVHLLVNCHRLVGSPCHPLLPDFPRGYARHPGEQELGFRPLQNLWPASTVVDQNLPQRRIAGCMPLVLWPNAAERIGNKQTLLLVLAIAEVRPRFPPSTLVGLGYKQSQMERCWQDRDSVDMSSPSVDIHHQMGSSYFVDRVQRQRHRIRCPQPLRQLECHFHDRQFGARSAFETDPASYKV